MAAATRIYVVSHKPGHLHTGGPEANHRLVRAANASQAMRHVAENTLAVGVARQDELVELLTAGVKVENAGHEHASGAIPSSGEAAGPSTEPLWPDPVSTEDSDDEDEEDDSAVITKPVAKYRCPMTGSTWSGHGLMPRWLKVEMDKGRKLTEFVV